METRKIRRALLTVSDKQGVVELAQALSRAGTELVATGRTAQMLKDAGLPVVPIEQVSGSPEAFQGRMKTLSFPVCGGILYRRGDASDEADLAKLNIRAIDCVVVNFYPFEAAAAKEGITPSELIEEVDIGGPTLVRAAAKNSPDVLVLTSPAQYGRVIDELTEMRAVRAETARACAREAWDRVYAYDRAIAERLGSARRRDLRYGENPHQKGHLEIDPASPIAWEESLTPAELSYNNILDLAGAYALASDLIALDPAGTGAVIVKHNNPCGVATVPHTGPGAQLAALKLAWAGDPVSAFGGVVILTEPLREETAAWLGERFIELVAAPGLDKTSAALNQMLSRRRNLKAVGIRRWGEVPVASMVSVPGGRLVQTPDVALSEKLTSMTQARFSADWDRLSRFGIAVCRALKSNALAIVREVSAGSYQLVGAGQGQPNRVDALRALAIPRARAVLAAEGGAIGDCVLVSDAFFPFKDTVEAAAEAGLRRIVQPGGSIKDQESIDAANAAGVAMAVTGVRHFRH